MNNLKIFENSEFGKIRTVVDENGEPWFVVNDICQYFGVTNKNRVMGNIDDEDKGGTQMDTPGGKQNFTTLNESGLYTLLFNLSPKKARGISKEDIEEKYEKVRAFKRWVTHEVLPTIRKHGAYMKDEVIERTLSDPDYLIKLATILKEEKAKRALAEAQIERDKPKVLFADTVSASKRSCLIGELAKLITQEAVRTGRTDKKIGQNTLFAWMRNNGYLCKSGERRNQPKQIYVEQGLFELKKGSYVDGNGVSVVTSTPKVTGKGQVYFVSKILG